MIDSLPYLARVILAGTAIVGTTVVIALAGAGWYLATLYGFFAYGAPLYRRALAVAIAFLPLVVIAGVVAVKP